MATFLADTTGKMIASAGPALRLPPTQHVTGSYVDAASAKTIDAQIAQANATKALGAGLKGGRRVKRGGAVNLNAQIPYLPEAGTIKGVSHTTNHLTSVNNLNQLKADSIYDSQINATPYQVAGKRRSRKTRRKSNGRRNNRTYRGKRSKSTHNRRRSSRSRK